MATTTVLMTATSAGEDRQHIHEALHKDALAVHGRSRLEDLFNDLLDQMSNDKMFNGDRHRLDELCNPEEVSSRAPRQVLKVHSSKRSRGIPPFFSPVIKISLIVCVWLASQQCFGLATCNLGEFFYKKIPLLWRTSIVWVIWEGLYRFWPYSCALAWSLLSRCCCGWAWFQANI